MTHYVAQRRFAVAALCGFVPFEPLTDDPEGVDCPVCSERLSTMTPEHLAALKPDMPMCRCVCCNGLLGTHGDKSTSKLCLCCREPKTVQAIEEVSRSSRKRLHASWVSRRAVVMPEAPEQKKRLSCPDSPQ